jgi:hypothetical protein
VVVCHVHASVAPLTEADTDLAAVDADPGLPILDDLDAVWECARRSRAEQ